MQNHLIALVAVAVMSHGVRHTIQPGEAVPELSSHDERELIAAGAIQDLAALAADKEQDAHAEALSRAMFERARADVQAELTSRLAPEVGPEDPAQDTNGAAPMAATEASATSAAPPVDEAAPGKSTTRKKT